MRRLVIVGGGHAAAQLCASLADLKFEGSVHLASDEPELPYHRPPLSKGFVKDPQAGLQLLRAEAAYRDAGVQLHLDDGAVAIDRAARSVRLRSGAVLDYDLLVLATGAGARTLPGLPGNAEGVLTLRAAADAAALRERLAGAARITVIGGGYIGLELAASARHLGKEVQVIEAAPRLLARVASPEVAERLARWHAGLGVQVELGTAVESLRFDAGGRVEAVVAGGRTRPTSLVLLGIGAQPNIALARAAGLACDDGIAVDSELRTSDAAIYAIGDCASFPHPRSGARVRLESVQNANDQARCVAHAIAGTPQRYGAVPWFWSEQGALRLQIAGWLPRESQRVLRAASGGDACSVLHYADGVLQAVESIDSMLDHMAARKLLERGISPPMDKAADASVALKSFL